MLARDLAKPVLVPREERTADSTTAEVRIDKAHVLVDARPVDLLIPPHAAVRHGATAHVDDDEVAGGIAALEVLIAGGDSLRGLDAIVA